MPSSSHKKSIADLRKNRNYRVKSSLKYSVLDGSMWAAMMGLTQNYMTPFALRMQATNSQISLLSSIPALLTSISQLLSPGLLEKAGTRKALILPMVFLNGLMFLPIMLVPFIFPVGQVWWLLAFMTLSSVAGAVVNPAWGSMMADLVPMRLRGRYFGNRGMINTFTTLVFSLIAGGILAAFDGPNIFIGFVIIFSAALGFRMLSFLFLAKQYEPVRELKKDNSPSMGTLLRQVGTSSIGKFILMVILTDFCVGVSGPYFAVFMLRDLNFSYIEFTLVCAANTLANVLFLNYWGKRADHAGNLRIIKIVAVLMPLVPTIWLVSTNVVYLTIANAFSGFVWAGYGLSATNYVYDASDPSYRHKQLAVFNGLDGLAMFLGFFLGGLIVDQLPMLLGYQLRSIFLLSGIGRGLVALILLRKLTEVRQVTSISTWDLMKLKFDGGVFRKIGNKVRETIHSSDEDASEDD
jgi:MFS family permease